MSGRRIAAFAGVAALACAAACGSFGSTVEPGDAAAPPGDAAAPVEASEDDARYAEPPLLYFACGPNSCQAGTQVCCSINEVLTCAVLDGGCATAAAEAGVDAAAAAPPLGCTSYRACPRDSDCCYHADRGAACEDRCESDEARLCQLGRDDCGTYADCVAFEGAPQPEIGRCRSSGGGSSGGSYFNP